MASPQYAAAAPARRVPTHSTITEAASTLWAEKAEGWGVTTCYQLRERLLAFSRAFDCCGMDAAALARAYSIHAALFTVTDGIARGLPYEAELERMERELAGRVA